MRSHSKAAFSQVPARRGATAMSTTRALPPTTSGSRSRAGAEETIGIIIRNCSGCMENSLLIYTKSLPGEGSSRSKEPPMDWRPELGPYWNFARHQFFQVALQAPLAKDKFGWYDSSLTGTGA